MDDLTPEQRRERMCPCTPEPVLPGYRSAEEARAAAERALAAGETHSRVLVHGEPCTPSTEHVRAVYAAQHGAILADEHGREFDRWLAEHDDERVHVAFVDSKRDELREAERRFEHATEVANSEKVRADRLRAVIENAPHDEWCQANWDHNPCTCWKADALG